MTQQIAVVLRFNIQATDGLVIGYGKMDTFISGELPRIGERLRPCTCDSDLNYHIDNYLLRVVEVCRNVGGNFTQTIYCEVSQATWSVDSGQSLVRYVGAQQAISQWETLAQEYKSRTWRPDSQQGMWLHTLHLEMKLHDVSQGVLPRRYELAADMAETRPS